MLDILFFGTIVGVLVSLHFYMMCNLHKLIDLLGLPHDNIGLPWYRVIIISSKPIPLVFIYAIISVLMLMIIMYTMPQSIHDDFATISKVNIISMGFRFGFVYRQLLLYSGY